MKKALLVLSAVQSLIMMMPFQSIVLLMSFHHLWKNNNLFQ